MLKKTCCDRIRTVFDCQVQLQEWIKLGNTLTSDFILTCHILSEQYLWSPGAELEISGIAALHMKARLAVRSRAKGSVGRKWRVTESCHGNV